MKIKFKINRETLTLLNQALNNSQILMDIGKITLTKKVPHSIIFEIREKMIKKFFTPSKTSSVEFYEHTAIVFYDILQCILSSEQLAPDQFVKIDQLKNEIHQKLQSQFNYK